MDKWKQERAMSEAERRGQDGVLEQNHAYTQKMVDNHAKSLVSSDIKLEEWSSFLFWHGLCRT